MKTASLKTHKLPYVHEDEDFWKKHISDFSASGLTKKSYCDKAGINYGRFFHWIKKLSPSLVQKTKVATKEMLPVLLKQEPEKVKPSLLCTLTLKNGCVLNICDREGLHLILEKWS